MTMRTLAVLASFAALLAFPVVTRAQGAPVYHGNLKVLPANGLFQKSTMDTSGIATLRVRNWVLNLAMGSNGIAPDKEPILIAVGDTEKLVIPAGQVKASKNGKRFVYRNPSTTRGVQMLQIRRLKDDGDGTPRYRLTFTVKIDLSFILSEYPLCSPMAVIIGDDDGFSGVELDRPAGFSSTRVRVDGPCSNVANWPWVG
jgi:hypothetical protein